MRPLRPLSSDVCAIDGSVYTDGDGGAGVVAGCGGAGGWCEVVIR